MFNYPSPAKRAGIKKGAHPHTLRHCFATHPVNVVFTLSALLAPLVLQNKKVIYDLLFERLTAADIQLRSPPALAAAAA